MRLVVLPVAVLAQLVAVPIGAILGWQQRRTDVIAASVGRSWDDLPALRVPR